MMDGRTCRRFVVVMGVWVSTTLGQQTLRYVDDDAPLGGDGTSWNKAYKYLQGALLEQANPPVTEIRIAGGIYQPDQDEEGRVVPGDRNVSFVLRDDLLLAGGYRGLAGGGNPDDRDINLFVSTLSGNIAGPDNSYHVLRAAAANPSAVADGFTVAFGDADGTGSNGSGGGFYNQGVSAASPSTPTIRYCTFSNNNAIDGGGVYNATFAHPLVEYCLFDSNSAQRGGGMQNTVSSTPTLNHCAFTRNNANFGGGMYSSASSHASLLDCTFEANQAQSAGAGMSNSSSDPMLMRVRFTMNTCVGGGDGGAMYNSNSDAKIIDCIFTANRAGPNNGLGGAIYNSGGVPSIMRGFFDANSAVLGGGIYNNVASPEVTDGVFVGNFVTDDGGAVYNINSSPVFINSLFSGNRAGPDADDFGGAVFTTGSTQNSPDFFDCTFNENSAAEGPSLYAMQAGSQAVITLRNCIMWGSAPDNQVKNAGTTLEIKYSDVKYDPPIGYPGEGNIYAEPQFVDADGLDDLFGTSDDNLRLLRCLPGECYIDAGDNTAVPAGVETDLAGKPRFVDDPETPDSGKGTPPVVDMGAYEFDASCTGKEKLKAVCKSKGAAFQVTGKLKKGQALRELRFRLDSNPETDILLTTDDKGRATAVFKDVPAGTHTVEVVDCGTTRDADCQ